MEKLIKIILGEFSIAFLFIFLILIVQEISKVLPQMPNVIPLLLTAWVISGIATPFVICFELIETLSNFKR
ncbi:hypothetical protein HOK51_04665 [Candidatus Woesearchaeota archaeon]|jgi:hypothetical protein|nr:hypothetical protein [Candidatus Woesearchaeota archaeon]MBT6519117.1 hypothetical protein [Candidatus Woesearchaeota archaeon]